MQILIRFQWKEPKNGIPVGLTCWYIYSLTWLDWYAIIIIIMICIWLVCVASAIQINDWFMPKLMFFCCCVYNLYYKFIYILLSMTKINFLICFLSFFLRYSNKQNKKWWTFTLLIKLIESKLSCLLVNCSFI